MDPAAALPVLLGLAVLLPLAAFTFILLTGPRLGSGLGHGAYVSIGAIVGAAVLSFLSLFIWLGSHWPESSHHAHEEHHTAAPSDSALSITPAAYVADEHGHGQDAHGHAADHDHAHDCHEKLATHYTGVYYTLGKFGPLEVTISYYIDSLTILMFCMVTLIASCIHFYAMGYMHDELHEIVDHEVTDSHGHHLHRPGRFWRFFQYLSLFCFSMLGLVLAGNIAMVFCFWELVGICSYFLIGFYVERQSASTAANKAFIVNRVGDFGMIIGLMALWSSVGTFAFGDVPEVDAAGKVVVDAHGDVVKKPGIFTQVRSPENCHQLIVPAGFVKESARGEMAALVQKLGPDATKAEIDAAVAKEIPAWRGDDVGNHGHGKGHGYFLLIVAGVGIFCGCVGKSAQFPLHTWLPDAMEGPTPVSALVHSATMVAAGVYLVGRFYPVFLPEVLHVIAIIGAITLFIAASIAMVATDIKRVLAYSTISQLGYMMLSLGLGGWTSGLMHLVTHAFFKSLLFMCSGSVIHAVHTNEMPKMGGLFKKMPITAITMLIGCLAIAGAGIPYVIGFSGYYSKDSILEQAYSFGMANGSPYAWLFFYAAAGGAAMTAFYMFRMWFLTFAGKPRDHHRYDHAHESPKVMYVPLVILSVFAIGVAWTVPIGPLATLNLRDLIEQARPAGTALSDAYGPLADMTWPAEHKSHAYWIVTLIAFGTAASGVGLATVMYAFGYVNAEEVRKQFELLHVFLRNKWYFDELYNFLFVQPVLVVSRVASAIDKNIFDRLIDGLAYCTKTFSVAFDNLADRGIVDGTVNLLASWTYATGVSLKRAQTGSIRQYVMFIVVGTIAIFVIISFFWNPSVAVEAVAK
ncbi:MAG TPA: NADH-quinone oxidoreductase subunit L [Pirellulaceae bacterium]|nr:NADH-quinone oxidoreductase subunit L [Pirellulaceae bacterium]